MSSTFNWIKHFGDFRFSISIKKSCLKCPICFREVLGPLIFGNNKIDKLCSTNWLQRKRLLSTARIVNIQCASRLIGKMVTDTFGEHFLFTCYMWIIFSTILKNDRVHVQGSAHYAPKIEYYILSCRPEKRIFVIQMLDSSKSWKIVTVSRKKC